MRSNKPIDEVTKDIELQQINSSIGWNQQIEDIYGQSADGPLEVLDNPTAIDSIKHVVRVGAIALAEVGVKIGLLHVGERVFEADYRGIPNVAPSYKLRTMKCDPKKQALHAELRANGQFVKGVHDQRTKIGSWLAKTSIDEIPNIAIHLLTGDLKFFAKARPLQAEEMVGKLLVDACRDMNIDPKDVAKGMSSGVCNEIATMNGRVMDEDGMRKFVVASTRPKSKLSSKLMRLKHTFSKEFIKQTSSVNK
ncbi:sugar transferase [Candidatus Saccharibacteria bacterium]|nr:sugar transferase [Candidatus Saccharibacteria bacterium]